MSSTTGIEWTDISWNPTTGCDRVSPGCDHCYALTMAGRLKAMGNADYQRDGHPNTSGPGFGVTLHHDRLTQPLRWRKPRSVFVNSMSDLFHKQVPDDYIARVWAVMAQTPQHTYQILTKRHGRLRSLIGDQLDGGQRLIEAADWETGQILYDAPWPLPNVWLGVSVEDQARAELRVPALLDTAAAVRFLSCEPLLGHVDIKLIGRTDDCTCAGYEEPAYMHEPACGLTPGVRDGIDWVIVGGESGPNARPMHPDWARSLRDQCAAAGVPYFFKQWGEWTAAPSNYGPDVPERARASTRLVWAHGTDVDGQIMLRAGKHRAGRELDGRTHDAYPA